MSDTAETVNITIYDVLGKTLRLSADSAAVDHETWARLSPTKIFGASPLMISLPDNLTVLPTAPICRVDIDGPNLPTWPFIMGAVSVTNITVEQFRASYDHDAMVSARKGAHTLPGSEQLGYTEYVLMNNTRLIWEVKMVSMELVPRDFNSFIQRLFQADGLHAFSGNGGYIIINPKNIKRMSFYPGPAIFPPGTVRARVDMNPAA